MSVIPFDSDLLPKQQMQFPTLHEASSKSLFDLDDQYAMGKGFNNVANLELNNLATPGDIDKLQNQANDIAKNRYTESTWQGLTLRNAVSDVAEAMTGIISDVYKNNGNVSIVEILTKNNRIRGMGLIFIMIAIASLVFL